MTSWSPKFTWDRKLFSCANSRSSKNFILFVSLYQITVVITNWIWMSLLKLYPQNFFSAHCCKFSLDDGISRALSSSSSSSPVLRGSIIAALFERVACTSFARRLMKINVFCLLNRPTRATNSETNASIYFDARGSFFTFLIFLKKQFQQLDWEHWSALCGLSTQLFLGVIARLPQYTTTHNNNKRRR